MGASRVVVVGAGVGGLTTGIALSRAGVDVVIVERHSDPRIIESGGGFILWNNAVRALQHIGLADELRERGAELEFIEWRHPNNRSFATWPIGDIGRTVGAPALGVRRTALQSALVQAVPEGALRLGLQCTGFEETGDGIVAQLSDGSEERGDALIGADGIHSTVRAQLYGPLPKPRFAGYHQNFAVTDFHNELLTPGKFLEIDGRGYRFFAFPVGGGETYWAATTLGPEDPAEKAGTKRAVEGTKDHLLELYAGWPDPVEAMIKSTDESAMFRRQIVDRNPTKEWGRGRVTMLGDAVHPITPNLGQGAGQAIEDAVVLSKRLAAASDVPAALREYEASRYKRTKSFVIRSRMIGEMGTWQNPVVYFILERVAPLMIRGPALLRHRKDMAYEF